MPIQCALILFIGHRKGIRPVRNTDSAVPIGSPLGTRPNFQYTRKIE